MIKQSILIFIHIFYISISATECESALTQSDLNLCANKRIVIENVRLDSIISIFKTRLNREQSAQLIESQNDWVKFRESACKFELSGSIGGSIYPQGFALCLVEFTKERNEYLRKLIICKEGDSNCPAPAIR